MNAILPLVIEAALRALVAAGAVWTGLRLLRVQNVIVLKATWALVLVAALALPLTPNWPVLPAWVALRLPAISAWPSAERVSAAPAQRSNRQSQYTPVYEAVPQGANSYSGGYPAPAVSDSDLASTSVLAAHRSSEAALAFATKAQANTVPVAPTSAASTAQSSRLTTRVLENCVLLYLGMALALFSRLLLGLAAACRLWITAEPVLMLPDGSTETNVRFSSRVASPVNIGSGIVLPAEYRRWDEEKLRIVLAHERSHIRQGDFYLQLLAGVYACLFWFSPLGWWLKRKLYELGEAISDRAGLEQAASRASYAQLLLEFAVLPRPTLTGVAMARTSHLSQRIERLLNESSFRQAFAACGRRALLAAVLVPAALLTATAVVSVQAASSAMQSNSDALSGQSKAEQVTGTAPAPAPSPAPAAAPDAVPAPPAPADAVIPAPPAPPADAVIPAPPVPPAPLQMDDNDVVVAPHVDVNPHVHVHPKIADMAPMPPFPPNVFHFDKRDFAFAYGFGQDGDPYAVVGSDGRVTRPRGRFFRNGGDTQSDIERARKQAHGSFLWFQHEGKSYIVDDPGIVAQIEAMNKPMDDLQSQMRDLGKQMREFGSQQRQKARQMRDAAVQTPDLSKELAALKAAEASLQAKQGATITQKEIADLQREIGRVQGELGSLQGKLMMEQGGFGKAMSEFGEQQGKLGSQMGKLGAEMGRVARENQSKMNDIINQSLSNGKAKPVQ